MPKPTWFDWLTVAAIVLGPVLALFAQRVLDWLREKKTRRVQLYLTLMETRASPLAPAHVQALNSIDVVFNRGSDKSIRDAWRRVMEHLVIPSTTPGWGERLNDLKVDLYQAMGSAVGYEFTTDYLKRQIYGAKLKRCGNAERRCTLPMSTASTWGTSPRGKETPSTRFARGEVLRGRYTTWPY